MPEDNLPVPEKKLSLDRSTIERVLARAAELQAATPPGEEGDLSESQLLDIGREVGLSTTTINQALAEERSRIIVPEESGLVSTITGPAVASASRAVPGTPAEVLAHLDTMMQRDECLQVQRRFPDRITWEPRSGWIGTIQRGLNFSGRAYYLCRASQVAATVVPVEGNRVLVRLDADISDHRTTRVRWGGVMLGGGVLGSAAVVAASTLTIFASVIVAAIAAVPLAIGGAAAYAIARQHREMVERTLLSLEQLLDRLEYETPRLLP
jgi:hypothetical protein